MWIILGIGTLVSTIINIYFGINEHVYTKWATAFALSFISLTVLSQYFMVKKLGRTGGLECSFRCCSYHDNSINNFYSYFLQ